MAIARGAGTEIIRSAYFEDVDSTTTTLIYGEQHHIYTILNVTIYVAARQDATNNFQLYVQGYDSKAGTTDQSHLLAIWTLEPNKTFVWGDKFSFNGYEPVNFTGPMDDATKQNAIADQGSGVSQYLWCRTTHADDSIELGITYIDQNNA